MEMKNNKENVLDLDEARIQREGKDLVRHLEHFVYVNRDLSNPHVIMHLHDFVKARSKGKFHVVGVSDSSIEVRRTVPIRPMSIKITTKDEIKFD